MKLLSLEEVVDTFSQNIPDWQRQINLTWLTGVHNQLKENGVWGASDLGTIYRKVGDGFVLEAEFHE